MAETEDGKGVSLEKIIAEARKVLTEHNGYLRGNETATRALVIDRVLTALGWDIKDPARVLLEHRANGNKVDYVLLSSSGKETEPLWSPSLRIRGRRRRIGGRHLDTQRKSVPATRC